MSMLKVSCHKSPGRICRRVFVYLRMERSFIIIKAIQNSHNRRLIGLHEKKSFYTSKLTPLQLFLVTAFAANYGVCASKLKLGQD